jgi:hypothetical protein
MVIGREARLRPASAGRYPGIRAGEWTSAAVLTDQVLALWLMQDRIEVLRGRALPPADFEFRGGSHGGGERQGLRLLSEVA